MRILILGGTSLTGPYAVRRLHAIGHEVTIFHRGEHEAEFPPGVRHVHGDFAQLPREASDPAPDVVVHMWAMTEMDAESLVKRFRCIASRAVVISSGDVYRAYGRLTGLESGPPDPIPLTEDAPLRESRYPYRKMAPNPDHWMTQYDKVLVEQVLVGQSDLPTTVLRFPAVLVRRNIGDFGAGCSRCCLATWNCVFKMDGPDGAGRTVWQRTSRKPLSLHQRIRPPQDGYTMWGSLRPPQWRIG